MFKVYYFFRVRKIVKGSLKFKEIELFKSFKIGILVYLKVNFLLNHR
jgi:hypothetical protein